jgi:hypothetical protein
MVGGIEVLPCRAGHPEGVGLRHAIEKVPGTWRTAGAKTQNTSPELHQLA